MGSEGKKNTGEPAPGTPAPPAPELDENGQPIRMGTTTVEHVGREPVRMGTTTVEHVGRQPVRIGTTTVEHVGREPEPVVTPGEPVEPGTITLPEVKITGHVPTAFEKQQAAVKAMDPKAVIVDGVVRPPNAAVQLEGDIKGVSHNDKTGLTTIDIKDKRGNIRHVSFKEPNGVDEHGNPTHHPLQEMADRAKAHQVDFNQAKLAIDGKGNIDYTVGNAIAQQSGHDGPGAPKDLPVSFEAQVQAKQQAQPGHHR